MPKRSRSCSLNGFKEFIGLPSRLVILWWVMVYLFASCQQGVISPSDPSYAHRSPERMFSTPLARLSFVKEGYARNFSNVAICVQDSHQTISSEELLFETELAFSKWLAGAGLRSADWEYFAFNVEQTCSFNDANYSGVIVLADEQRSEPEQKLEERFTKPVMKCWSEEKKTRCRRESFVKGWGWAGQVQRITDQNGDLLEVNAVAPGFTLLNQYVRWMSIADDLLANKAIEETLKVRLVDRYRELVANRDRSWEDLQRFALELAENQIMSVGDIGFRRSFDAYGRDAKDDPVEIDYMYEGGVFHVLLHEVGHMFGMHHADNPDENAVTGIVGDGEQNEIGQWTTKHATMAYGVEYLYLKEDDLAGIANAFQLFSDSLGSDTFL